MQTHTIRLTETQLNWLENQSESSAAIVRDLIDERRRERTESEANPDGERLARAYDELVTLAIDRHNDGPLKLSARPAINHLAKTLGIGEHLIKTVVLDELRREGFLRAQAGTLWIKPRGCAPGNNWTAL